MKIRGFLFYILDFRRCYNYNIIMIYSPPDHSEAEERFIILGLSHKANLLIVCHCYRASDTVIRIISARKATKTESQFYGK